MNKIDRIRLFKSETSKADLLANKQDRLIAVLDEMVLRAVINYNIDSNHTVTVELDSDLAEGIINKIGFKQIIYARTLEGNYEPFILTGISKILDDRIEITGVHWLTEITSKIFCDDLKPRGLNANLMLKHIIEGSEEYKQGKQYTRDLETSGNIDILANCNLWQVSLGDYLEYLQSLYGNCEVRKKGFMLSLIDYVGSRQTRYNVNYGENLISSTTNEDYILVKGVLAKGFDGIRGDIIYSDKISSGTTKVIEYPIRLREEGEEDQEGYTYYDTLGECQKALEDLARKEFEVNKLDEIVITYDIEFLDLSTVEESNITEKSYLEVGDVVNTRIDKYNMNINTRVVEFNYDILGEEIEDITLSNADIDSLKVPTLNTISKEIENKPSKDEITYTTRQEITDFINAGFGGHVKNYNDEIYILDSPEKENAVKCLRLNMNGIAGSTTGWQGPYNVAITVDGQVMADRITSGILKSFNGKSWINMENGTFNLANKLKFDGSNFDIDLSSKDLATNTSVDNKLSSKVSNSEFSTKVEQNAYSVKIAWNKISNYVQFENGGLSIYNGAISTSQKRAVFDENGNHFWRDGYYLGKIGTNQYVGDSSIKGIVFDLESQGGYMTWAVKRYSTDSTYNMMWSYANKTIGNYGSGKLHAGCDIDMHNFYLRNVNFEGGGITGTMNFVQVTSMNSNGTAGTWVNNAKLQFQNGILISGTWN